MSAPPEKDLAGASDAIKNSPSLEALTSPFDNLLSSLQTPEARAGLLAAINATPKELGEAAVRAAMKKKNAEKA
jgi:hypothetical protein